MKTSTRPARRAFTLIEILIVVSILGILASIVVPAIGHATDDSRDVAVQTQLHMLRTQIGVYQARNDGANPASIDALVVAGYLPKAPVHPGLDVYEYDALTGTVISTLDPSW